MCSDDEYGAAGAEVVDRASAWAADLVFKVNAPLPDEVELANEGGMVISYFPPAQNPELVDKLRAQRLAVVAMTQPRLPKTITRVQTFDALYFMANIGGYRGVVEAANAFGRFFAGQKQFRALLEPEYDISALERSIQESKSIKAADATVPTRVGAPKKVAIIGSGNWGSAMAKIIGLNCARHSHLDSEVRMWVYEEEVEGRRLSEIINEQHENVKYLPGIKLPVNVRAVPDIGDATRDANVLVFVLPHQFLGALCDKIRGEVAADCIGVSLIKGVHFDDSGIVLISDLIKQDMGGMDVGVLMGANLANEVSLACLKPSLTPSLKPWPNLTLMASRWRRAPSARAPSGARRRPTASCSTPSSTRRAFASTPSPTFPASRFAALSKTSWRWARGSWMQWTSATTQKPQSSASALWR